MSMDGRYTLFLTCHDIPGTVPVLSLPLSWIGLFSGQIRPTDWRSTLNLGRGDITVALVFGACWAERIRRGYSTVTTIVLIRAVAIFAIVGVFDKTDPEIVQCDGDSVLSEGSPRISAFDSETYVQRCQP
jgi:hypothetical protein